MQGNLVGFFDLPVGANAAPRKRQAYASKRLQQVVSNFRKQQAQLRTSTPSGDADGDEIGEGEGSDLDSGPGPSRPAKRRKKSDDSKSKGKKGKAKDEGGLGDSWVADGFGDAKR